MSNDRRGDGNGAVVAIVVVLAILILCGGGLVVVGGLFFSVRSSAPLPARVAAPPVLVSPQPAPPQDSGNLESSESPPRLMLELTPEGKYLLDGQEIAADQLQESLQARIDAGNPPKLQLRPHSTGNDKLYADTLKVLKELEIDFVLKD